MKTTRLFILCAIIAVLMTGCGVYNPMTVHIPLIHERGEVQLEGALLPTTKWPVPLDMRASVAWGITNHLAVQAAIDPFRSYSQAMAGLYFPQENNFVWEIYVGVGTGKGRQSNIGGREPYTIPSGTFRSVFVQGDAGWLEMTRKGHLDLAFSLKTGVLMGEIKEGKGVPYEVNGEWITDSATTLADNILLEPTVELRFGWERFKFNVKTGLCYLVPWWPEGYHISRGLLSLGAGMSYRF